MEHQDHPTPAASPYFEGAGYRASRSAEKPFRTTQVPLPVAGDSLLDN